MAKNLKIKVNPRAARQLAREVERNLRKAGLGTKIPDSDVRELQKELNKLGK